MYVWDALRDAAAKKTESSAGVWPYRVIWAKGRKVGADGCSWCDHCPGPGEGAGPDPAMLRSGGERMIAHPAQPSHCLGLTREADLCPLVPSILPGTLCLHSAWCGSMGATALALPQESSGRGELHRQTHTSAGGFDEKVKNNNQTISFSSYSEAGNNDMSHMFQR